MTLGTPLAIMYLRDALTHFNTLRGSMYSITDATGNVLASLNRTAAPSTAWHVARNVSKDEARRVWIRKDGAVIGSLHAANA